MLAFLLDEHISHRVAEQVRRKRPNIRIESVQRWKACSLRQTADDLVLTAALMEGLTLVSYDQKTIPPILVEIAMRGDHHSGVVFADRSSLPSGNIGDLVNELVSLFDRYGTIDWTDTVMYLSPGT